MKQNILYLTFLTFSLSLGITGVPVSAKEAPRWSLEKVQKWNVRYGWLCGSNFIPSTAVNQLEMWQADTFDPVTIDRELGWAEETGMNCMRVFLHHLAWQTDPEGFKKRMDQYLQIAEKHGIKTMFVFFDDCWNPVYHPGKQPDPVPGKHNSGWVQDPGELPAKDSTLLPILETYIKDILKKFKNDRRIALWDLYNEPGHGEHKNQSLPLLQKVFEWSREINPSQPLTSAAWKRSLKEITRFQLEASDVITYHTYDGPKDHQAFVDELKTYDRPLICSEYMARNNNSLIQNIMPMLKKQNIGAINWGLVTGKTNTRYAWSKIIADGSEPELWFHDIFYANGKPYKQEEIDCIKSLTGVNK
jgi:hypothetical protein